ncbi:hypothetical protein ACFV1N_46555 [Streptosporangium canum]|uniref:hypothetical protein n=1 Tax=Streptosporangium canum TaxID=324952 RepID=UPI00368ECC7F
MQVHYTGGHIPADIEELPGQDYTAFRRGGGVVFVVPPLAMQGGAAFFLSGWWQSGPRVWWADMLQIIDDPALSPRRPRVVSRRILAAGLQQLEGQDYRPVPRLRASE